MSPSTVLMLTFVGLAVGLFAFFWGTALFLQSALYNAPAPRLPVRAAGAALLVGGFLTFWTYANTRADSKDRYGTLFEFNSTTAHDFTEFTAIRRDANKKDTPVPHRKLAGKYVEADNTSKLFNMSTSNYYVAAIEVKEGDKTTKFEAQLDANNKYTGGNNRVFREAGGRRYIEFGQSNLPSPIYAPSPGSFVAALALNLFLFVSLFVALWPIMQYTLGHAIGGTVTLGLFVMLLLMPLLFDKNKVPEAPKQPAAEKA